MGKGGGHKYTEGRIINGESSRRNEATLLELFTRSPIRQLPKQLKRELAAMLSHYELLYSLAVISNLRQHIPEQRIQPGIVVFGIGHAFARFVQDDQPQTGAMEQEVLNEEVTL